MVGWSRRSRESNERRRRHAVWWASLSPEEKLEYERRRQEEWKREKPIFAAVMVTLALMLCFLIVGAMR